MCNLTGKIVLAGGVLHWWQCMLSIYDALDSIPNTLQSR